MDGSIMAAVQDELQALTGARTVPRVFINGEFYSDGSGTVQAAASGDLRLALAAAGIKLVD
jgi:glutaredoxin 3